MITAYQIESICEVFGPACEQFESSVCELHSERTAQMEHGRIEALIQQMGTELLRALFRAHSDLRVVREARRHDPQRNRPWAVLPDGAGKPLELLFFPRSGWRLLSF